jgi:outer membrane protein assembly factor BamB
MKVILYPVPLLYCIYRMARKEGNVKTFSFRELTIWRKKLPNVDCAVLPPSNTRPNPLASGDKLFVSVFSPGAVLALRRDDGRLIWRRELSQLAGSSVDVREGRLLARSANRLYAIDQDSGRILWSFCPYDSEREWIYSSPSACENRVYIGDRKGFLHCLDAETGKTIWRRQTNRAQNGDVNSTPIVTKGMVVVTTNAKTALAYNAGTGELIWKQKLDGPAVFGPLLYRRSLVALANSIYLLSAKTGTVQKHFGWKADSIAFAEATPKTLVVALRGAWPPMGVAEIVLLNESGVLRSTSVAARCISFRHCEETDLMYLSHLAGMDLLCPHTGDISCRITKSAGMRGNTALADVKDKKIYALTDDGQVYALEHPSFA